MTTLDVIIGILLAGGIVAGLRSGMIRQVLSIVGVVAAFLLGTQLMHTAGAMAETSLGISEDIAPLVGFVLVFMAVQLAVFVLGRLMEAVVGALKLGPINRLLGGGVGAFKAALILSIAFLVLGGFGVPTEETRDASALYEPVAGVIPYTWEYVVEAFPHVEEFTDEVGGQMRGRLPGAATEGGSRRSSNKP